MSGSSDPLRDDDPGAWARLIESLGPASMLVCVRERMSAEVATAWSPEDLWQEALLHVWRDRANWEWRGGPAFRRLVLQVVENRIRNAADALRAQKRGGGVRPLRLHDGAPGSSVGGMPVMASTTPSRIASDRERAALMHAALDELPGDLREVVRLRLFEELAVDEVAERLGLGASAVKHRFRKGALRYRAALRRRLASRAPGESS